MEERRNEILRELDRKGKVKVTDLSREFGCSEVTIRNDIKAMDIEGLLKRTHGGAVKLETAETESGRYSTESLYRNVAQKKQIAEMAYDFLEDREDSQIVRTEYSDVMKRSSSMMRRPVSTLPGRSGTIRKKGSRL